jgi:hypothetical protein
MTATTPAGPQAHADRQGPSPSRRPRQPVAYRRRRPAWRQPLTVFAGELFLALLLAEHDIGRAVHETSNLCRALGLLAVGGDWRDRSYGLTGTGQASALAALGARATGPRTIPW